MENASRGFLDAVRRSMRQVREVVGAATIDPALLTAAERIQYEGYLRRKEADAAIRALAEAGVPIRRICQRLGHSRKVVRAVLRGERTDVFRVRQSSLDAHLPWLDAQWDAGSRNATELWRRAKGTRLPRIAARGREWATRRRRAEQAQIERYSVCLGTNSGAMADDRSRPLDQGETLTVAAVEDGVPALVEAREVVALSRRWFGRWRRQARRVAHACWHRPRRLVRPRSRSGPSCGSDSDHVAMVERPDRGADHQTQAGKAPDVWPRQDRPVASSPDRIDLRMISESASEPLFHA